ncbi:MAG TPA: tetratricopeptide repeat protein [Candidatus Atribacteria bacterium]|nr:tetratricopeptide repeat protein [Candidatus Atribacteria bacterium]
MERPLFNNFKVKIGNINGLNSLDPGEIRRYFIGLFKEEFLVAAGHNTLKDFLLVSPIKNVLYIQLVKKRIFWILIKALVFSVTALFVDNFYIIISLFFATFVLLIIYFTYVPVSLQIVLDGGMRITISIKKGDIKKVEKFMEVLWFQRKIYSYNEKEAALRRREKLCRGASSTEERWREVRDIINDLLARGTYKKAQDFLEEYLREYPRDWRAWNELGRTYYMQNNREKAIECFKKSLELYPHYAPAIYNLGVTYEKIGKFKEALQFYEKYLEINPDAEDAQIVRFAIEDLRLRENL